MAFPLLSSGNYGYPKEQAFRIAVGLHLSEDETIELLKSAGYAFSGGCKAESVQTIGQELEAAAGAEGWVDVCKEPEGE